MIGRLLTKQTIVTQVECTEIPTGYQPDPTRFDLDFPPITQRSKHRAWPLGLITTQYRILVR